VVKTGQFDLRDLRASRRLRVSLCLRDLVVKTGLFGVFGGESIREILPSCKMPESV
jgi:hypothetical protein